MPFIRRGPSATTPDARSPRPTATSSPLGGPSDAPHRGELASVLSYESDRYTATVRTESGRTIPGVPRLRSTPGELAALTAGTQVLITYEFGPPIILGILNSPAGGNDDSEGSTITELGGYGGDGYNASQLTTRGNYRNASEPRDLVPGDWTIVSPDGSMFSLLTGGVALMKAGALSQVRAHLLTDLVEIISRNFRHITDMGEFTVTNTDGRINMRFRGGSDQRSEAGPDEERWTILFDLGAEGDLLNLELCTTEGQTLFRFHVDSSGHCEIFGVNGVTTGSGSSAAGGHAEEHSGDSTSTVGGDRTASTRGDAAHTVGGSVSTTAGADQALNAGNDLQLQAVRDVAVSAGRNLFVAAQGGDGDTAATVAVDGGNMAVQISSATSPDHTFELSTFAGNITLKSTQGGDILFDTSLGRVKATAQSVKLVTTGVDSVVLGGDTLTSHIAKFEELKQLLLQLFTALDTHTHSVSGAATGAPLVPIGAPLIGTIEQIKSLVAGVSS